MSDTSGKAPPPTPPPSSILNAEEADSEIVGDGDPVNAANRMLDINFDALLRLAARGKAVEDGLALAEKALELRERFEAQRVNHFREITQAVIDAKKDDPDEVERREGNRYRRGLMSLVSLVMLVLVGATIFVAVGEGNAVAFTALGSLSILSMVMVSVLASSGQLTVRNLTGLVKVLRGMQDEAAPVKNGAPKRKRGTKT